VYHRVHHGLRDLNVVPELRRCCRIGAAFICAPGACPGGPRADANLLVTDFGVFLCKPITHPILEPDIRFFQSLLNFTEIQ
jgi:hypothetical protein